MQLFASIVQNEFQPSKDTFAQEDIYAIYDLNHQIALLPDEQKKEIVMDIHAKRLKGDNDETLKIELERAITRGKLQVADDLNDTKQELSNTRKEAKRQKNRGDNAIRALHSNIEQDVINDYKKRLARWIAIPLFGIPLTIFFVICLYNIILTHFNNEGLAVGYVINIIASISLDILYFAVFGIRKILTLIRRKSEYIKNEIDARMKKAIESY